MDGSFGLPTVQDIIAELEKPGRDPRPAFAAATFSEGIEKISDLRPGMVLEGTVTNVAAFGAFVDVGVHQDGLVHVSALANRFVSDPREVVKSGQVVRVKVLEADPERKRISLTLRLDDEPAASGGRGGRARPAGCSPVGGRAGRVGATTARAATPGQSREGWDRHREERPYPTPSGRRPPPQARSGEHRHGRSARKGRTGQVTAPPARGAQGRGYSGPHEFHEAGPVHHPPHAAGHLRDGASTHWLATATAQAVLERGGNAFDAAAAAPSCCTSWSRTSTVPAGTWPGSSHGREPGHPWC